MINNTSDCMLRCPNQAHMLSESAQKNEALDLHEPSRSHHSTNKCRNNAKLFIKCRSDTISERW